MNPKRTDREARREEILAAAVRVFARKGFAATRVDEVAAEAGIGKGSIYLYFDGRDDILAAVFQSYARSSTEILRRVRTRPGNALDRLAWLVRSVVEAATAEPELARILLDLWAADRGAAELPLDMAGLYADHRAAVADLLSQGQEEGTVRPGAGPEHALVVVGAIEGCLLQWLVDPRLPAAETAAPILEVCLDGLRSREGN